MLKVACTSGPIFGEKYELVLHIFCTNNLQSGWPKAQIKQLLLVLLEYDLIRFKNGFSYFSYIE